MVIFSVPKMRPPGGGEGNTITPFFETIDNRSTEQRLDMSHILQRQTKVLLP